MLFWPFLCVTLQSFVFGIRTFSLLNINTNPEAQITACHITKNPEKNPEHVVICGFKGNTCSIAVYFNRSETQIQKAVKCDCWDVINEYYLLAVPTLVYNFLVHSNAYVSIPLRDK